MYEPLLFVHSWVRWAVFLGIVYFFCVSVHAIIVKREWTSADSYFIWAFNQAFLYQALFGFAIWLGASPLVRSALMDPKTIFANSYVTFWTVLHPMIMVFSIGVFHIGRARANRQPLNSRFRVYAVTFGLILFFVLCAIPWPLLSYGRPLFRIP